jgi:hypothetical protein
MMKALEADGEYLRQMTGEDHGPEFLGTCDGCGAVVPLDQLSLTAFIELDGFTCEECRRDTVVVAIASHHREPK